jgi:hypothetical protein
MVIFDSYPKLPGGIHNLSQFSMVDFHAHHNRERTLSISACHRFSSVVLERLLQAQVSLGREGVFEQVHETNNRVPYISSTV